MKCHYTGEKQNNLMNTSSKSIFSDFDFEISRKQEWELRELILSMDETLEVTTLNKNQLLSLYYQTVAIKTNPTTPDIYHIKAATTAETTNKFIHNMKNTPENALFDELPKTSDFATPIWADGGGRIVENRLVLKLKLTADLKQHIKNDKLSLVVIKRKEKGMFGDTHSILINQDEAPASYDFEGRNFLTIAEQRGKAYVFTLTVPQLKSLAYNFTPAQTKIPGQYITIELVDNGMQAGIFRYTKVQCKEAVGFKAAQKMMTPQLASQKLTNPVKEAKDHVDSFFDDL
jgi:hypothetical protein